MRRFRFAATPALVLSMIALLISLSGTAMAAVIISSNSQVASNTIAGHASISGVHANLIAGSIVSTDLSSAYKATLKVRCPFGLIAVSDLCVESAARAPATYDSALATCASAGRRLPDDAELALAFTGLGAPQDLQWTDDEFEDSGNFGAAVMAERSDRSLSLAWAPFGNPEAFRCVVSPHN